MTGSPATPASTIWMSTPTVRAKDVCRGVSTEQVTDHLAGHRLWVGGDAGGGDSVIDGEQEQPAPIQLGFEDPLKPCDPLHQFLDTAKRTDGFGLLVDRAPERVFKGLRRVHGAPWYWVAPDRVYCDRNATQSASQRRDSGGAPTGRNAHVRVHVHAPPVMKMR